MIVEQMLTEAISNLNKIGYQDKAEWFKERQAALRSPSTRFKALEELQDIWVGMGSFSDLSWPMEMKLWSWEFADTISIAVSNELAEINEGT